MLTEHRKFLEKVVYQTSFQALIQTSSDNHFSKKFVFFRNIVPLRLANDLHVCVRNVPWQPACVPLQFTRAPQVSCQLAYVALQFTRAPHVSWQPTCVAVYVVYQSTTCALVASMCCTVVYQSTTFALVANCMVALLEHHMYPPSQHVLLSKAVGLSGNIPGHEQEYQNTIRRLLAEKNGW